MVERGGYIEALIQHVEPQQAIRTGIAASAIAHLSVLMLVILFAEVHPFGLVTAEPVPVDIVTPEEVAQTKPEPPLAPKVPPSDTPDLSAKPAASSSPAPTPVPPEAVPQPPKQAASSPPPPLPPSSPSPPVGQMAAAQPPPTSPSPSPGYVPPEPDLSVKYHVMLGLPSGDPFDGPASRAADIPSNLVEEFRRHLKACSKLPPSVAPSDKLKIKLRVLMTLEGRLAAEPVLIEASASPKGPALMQSAIGALQACQPFTMLPADRYGEWKVLDLSFTPQDFAG